MQELIKVTVQNDRQLVSARDLYKGLGLKIRFSLWVSQNFEGFEEGKDFTSVFVDTEVENNGGVQVRKLKDYWLTIDMAKELCMMSKTEKGKEVRKYFIQVEKEFKAQKSLQQPDSYMIEDPIKRARRWIQEKEQYLKQKQLSDKQAKQLKDQEDDVIFSRTMLATNHSSKIRELAADLTKMGFVIGQNQLYELLRLKGYISKHSTQPMGSKVKCGYFVTRHGVNNGKAWQQTLVTPKGQRHIISKCLHGKWDDAYQRVMTSTFSI